MATQTNSSKVGLGKFLKGVKAELKKVSWPNRNELQSYTIVVLVTCTLAALGLWLFDTIFGQVIQFLIK